MNVSAVDSPKHFFDSRIQTGAGTIPFNADTGPRDQDSIISSEDESEPLTKVKQLPTNFKECSRDDLIQLISRLLTSLITINDETQPQIKHEQLTRFHSRTPPAISVHSYLTRLSHYSSLENAILIASIYYIDLLSSSYPTFLLNSLTVHRFLLTATTVASKGLCDSFCSNNHYAKVGGVNVGELNMLETEFLNRVGWRIVPRDFSFHQEKTTDWLQIRKVGIGCAAEVLDIYYRRTISLVGRQTQESEEVFVLEQQQVPLKRSADTEAEVAVKRLQ